MITYWLKGEDKSVRQQRLLSSTTPLRSTNGYYGTQSKSIINYSYSNINFFNISKYPAGSEAPDLIKRLKIGTVAVPIDDSESTSKRHIIK